MQKYVHGQRWNATQKVCFSRTVKQRSVSFLMRAVGVDFVYLCFVKDHERCVWSRECALSMKDCGGSLRKRLQKSRLTLSQQGGLRMKI